MLTSAVSMLRNTWAGTAIAERRFRSLKSECARAGEFAMPSEPRRLVVGYVEQHNGARLHQPLGYDTPPEWYYSGLVAA